MRGLTVTLCAALLSSPALAQLPILGDVDGDDFFGSTPTAANANRLDFGSFISSGSSATYPGLLDTGGGATGVSFVYDAVSSSSIISGSNASALDPDLAFDHLTTNGPQHNADMRWQGLAPGGRYTLTLYGGGRGDVDRSARFRVDTDGDGGYDAEQDFVGALDDVAGASFIAVADATGVIRAQWWGGSTNAGGNNSLIAGWLLDEAPPPAQVPILGDVDGDDFFGSTPTAANANRLDFGSFISSGSSATYPGLLDTGGGATGVSFVYDAVSSSSIISGSNASALDPDLAFDHLTTNGPQHNADMRWQGLIPGIGYRVTLYGGGRGDVDRSARFRVDTDGDGGYDAEQDQVGALDDVAGAVFVATADSLGHIHAQWWGGSTNAGANNSLIAGWMIEELGPPCAADVTTQGAPLGDPLYGVPDGQVTAADLQFYVNEWNQGCP